MPLEQEIILMPIISLVVSSPEELAQKIEEIKALHQPKSRYVALAIKEERVLTRMFHFQQMPLTEVRENVLLEAAELLSLPTVDIECDIQIFHSDQNNVEGMFLCAPKPLVQTYLAILDEAHLIPLKLTDALLNGIDAFMLKKDKELTGRVCFLDFSQAKMIHISVIQDHRCEFVRRVKYETQDEAKRSIIQTLQGVCAQSAVKKMDNIIFLGEVADKNVFIPEIKKNFDTNIHHRIFNPNVALSSWHPFFSLNLFRPYVFTLKARNALVLSTYLIVWILIVNVIFLALEIRSKEIMGRYLRGSFSQVEYEYAVNLRSQLK